MTHPMKASALLIAITGLTFVGCCRKPIPFLTVSSNRKALLYHLPTGYFLIKQFPHNSLYRETSIAECEKEYWFIHRSNDLDKAYTKFKSLILPGDIIWLWGGDNAGMFDIYRSVDVPQGICILRNNKIKAVLMTHMACDLG